MVTFQRLFFFYTVMSFLLERFEVKHKSSTFTINLYQYLKEVREMKEIEKEIPKIDLPQDWVTGKLSSDDIGLLSLYANYPCRLKAGIFALCLGGEVEASINLTHFKVAAGSFITILPGSIMQIHKLAGDLNIYFIGFSSDFINQPSVSKSMLEIHYAVSENPIFKPKEKALPLLKDYFELLVKTYEFSQPVQNRQISNHLFTGILMGVCAMYREQTSNSQKLSKSEQISQNFTQLVMGNYATQRNVAWYAKQLGITQAHLSTIIKQTTGKTCVEIITSMVIMDAKAQLKSTNLTIHDIAYALGFTNMSFFGKYFKRYVGMSPQEYRNS